MNEVARLANSEPGHLFFTRNAVK